MKASKAKVNTLTKLFLDFLAFSFHSIYELFVVIFKGRWFTKFEASLSGLCLFERGSYAILRDYDIVIKMTVILYWEVIVE